MINYKYYISAIWILVFGVLLIDLMKFKSIVLLIGILFSYLLISYKNKPDKKKLIIDEDIASWVNQLITTNDNNEKNRCYIKIYDRLRADSLSSKQGKDQKMLLDILKKYEPKLPLPVNLDTEKNYNISTSFLKMDEFKL